MLTRERLPHYLALMRIDKPIGTLLLMWPTLWALWIAASGRPDPKILLIFLAGVFFMRSAGCVMNDFADRKFDGYVKRTASRPLASGKVKPREALVLASLLSLIAFFLVLFCNTLTIKLAFLGAFFAASYPFLKRITHLPQLGLGVAFSWGVIMAFAAETGVVPLNAWILFVTAALWPIIYDTMYAMVDRVDDLKIGVKSAAILFNQKDKLIIGILQLVFLGMLIVVGMLFNLNWNFYLCLLLVGLFFLYQQLLIKDRDREKCLQAFKNNNYVGMLIFAGILLSYY